MAKRFDDEYWDEDGHFDEEQKGRDGKRYDSKKASVQRARKNRTQNRESWMEED